MKVVINGNPILILNSYADWIHRCPSPIVQIARISGKTCIYIDVNGNLAAAGSDFRAAEDQDSYPITLYEIDRIADVKTAAVRPPEMKPSQDVDEQVTITHHEIHEDFLRGIIE